MRARALAGARRAYRGGVARTGSIVAAGAGRLGGRSRFGRRAHPLAIERIRRVIEGIEKQPVRGGAAPGEFVPDRRYHAGRPGRIHIVFFEILDVLQSRVVDESAAAAPVGRRFGQYRHVTEPARAALSRTTLREFLEGGLRI